MHAMDFHVIVLEGVLVVIEEFAVGLVLFAMMHVVEVVALIVH
ncbi:hypothetical protein PRV_02945 [Mycoplasma parvum str. Indiana]|uniref:Uncharacterized protein n=1 Tax=Mycoplasma parvum str. Indiana TaxID=1403316 RepID=U5ND99_9MOLU|nr:hypothetical protein PRV_02945 [Mycoplasma parvum str. Indiana]